MKAKEFLPEDKFGTNPKRPARAGSRPPRSKYNEQIHQLHIATGWDVDHLEMLKLDELADLHQKHVGQGIAESEKKGLYYYVNKRKKAGTSRPASNPKAPTEQAWKDAAKTAKTEGVAEDEEQFCANCGGSLAEAGKASRALCVSGRPDNDLGASNLASCKSQGLRARDGNKSHKLGKSAKSRIKVGGHRIKGKKYGGPLPDWGS